MPSKATRPTNDRCGCRHGPRDESVCHRRSRRRVAVGCRETGRLVAVGDVPADDYAVMGRPLPAHPIKKIMVPTTSGTGSEMTRTSVYGVDQGRKVWAWGQGLRADLSILDPMMSALPPALTAATGLGLWSTRLKPLPTKASRRSLRQWLFRRSTSGRKQAGRRRTGRCRGTREDGAGLRTGWFGDRRLWNSFGARLRSRTCDHGPVHHGRAVALALRVILPWASGIRPDRFAPSAVALGARPSANDDDASTAKLAAPLFEALIRSVGLPVSLEDVGLGEADTERLVEITLAPENKPMVDSNTVEPSVDDLRMMARQILTAR